MDEIERAAAETARVAALIAGDDTRLYGIVGRALVESYYRGKYAGFEYHGQIHHQSGAADYGL
jgi:hypothetical protein